MKIDRLIGIITILLQQDKITAPELAKRFEVSKRTINRDIEDICKAGIPIITTQGYNGGISIADTFKIDKALFSQEELQTILAGLRGIDTVSQTSHFIKMIEKMSNKKNRIISDDVIIIDLASHYQASLTPKIETIKQAIQTQHTLVFQYCYEKGESKRRIEPYRLVFKWSSWYVFGFCMDRRAYRLFKLNRLWNLEMEEETFSKREIPEEELSFGDYLAEGNFHLKALFAESEKHRLIEEYGIDSFTAYENNGSHAFASHPYVNKKLLLERDFASYENMREWIFSFGDKVQVLEPKALQDDRKKQAENIIRQ